MRVTREKLYEEIWAEPIRTVAPRYGVSDVALRKTCVKLGIPLPEPGMWARLQHGYKVTQKPLPTKWKGPTEANVGSTTVKEKIHPQPEEQVVPIDAFTRPPHAFTEPQAGARSKKLDPAPAAALLQGLPDTLHARALGIVSAFCHACDARRSRSEIKVEESLPHLVMYLTEVPIAIRFMEAGARTGRRDLADAQPRLALRLLRARGDDRELRTRWEDLKERPLEIQANGIFVALISASTKRNEERLARIEQDRRYAQVARERQIYDWEIRALNVHLKQWERATQLRAFAEHLRKAFAPSNEDLVRFCAWLDSEADRHDPAKDTPKEFLKPYSTDWLPPLAQ